MEFYSLQSMKRPASETGNFSLGPVYYQEVTEKRRVVQFISSHTHIRL